MLTSAAYAHLNAKNDRLLAGCDRVLAETGLPGYTVGISSKGCVTFSPERIVDDASFMATQDPELPHLAWLAMMNWGVFMTPGREEEWTLSVAHTAEDCDRYVGVFEEMARELVA